MGSAPEINRHFTALSEHEELLMLRAALQATDTVVLLTDPNLPDNPIVYVNQGFETLTGYSRDEVLGRNCRFLQGDDHNQEAVRQLREAIVRQESIRVELRNYRKDGSLFWNELHVSPVVMGNRLTHFLGIQNDVTDRKEAEAALATLNDKLEYEAHADPLTHLGNRRRLHRQLEHEAERLARLGSSFCVAFLDLDHFKRVNDSYGHAVGDDVLTELGQLLQQETRSMDTVGRWGGEEFIVLLPGLSLSEAHSAVERLRLRVAAHPFPKVGFLTVSVGVALHRPSMTLDALLLWADRALYQAKELGRDRVVSEINPDAHQEKVNSEPLN